MRLKEIYDLMGEDKNLTYIEFIEKYKGKFGRKGTQEHHIIPRWKDPNSIDTIFLTPTLHAIAHFKMYEESGFLNYRDLNAFNLILNKTGYCLFSENQILFKRKLNSWKSQFLRNKFKRRLGSWKSQFLRNKFKGKLESWKSHSLRNKFKKRLSSWVSYKNLNNFNILLLNWKSNASVNHFKIKCRTWVKSKFRNRFKMKLSNWVSNNSRSGFRYFVTNWASNKSRNKFKLKLSSWKSVEINYRGRQ